jgi:tetratricopeptide (TPR) repeat protein
MAKGNYQDARAQFEAALTSPERLGEAKHLLANQSDIHVWLGDALSALGDREGARKHWKLAAEYAGDFQGMSVRAYSEMTYFTARAMERLGQKPKASKLFRELSKYAKDLEKQKAKIDYFATSLPTMLLFEDDLQKRQTTDARFMQALAEYGLGKRANALKLVKDVLKRDPAHGAAADFKFELEETKR